MDVLTASGKSSELEFPDAKPAVLLIVGVNGGGKTTTIGKLAYKYGSEGVKVRTALLHPARQSLLPLAQALLGRITHSKRMP